MKKEIVPPEWLGEYERSWKSDLCGFEIRILVDQALYHLDFKRVLRCKSSGVFFRLKKEIYRPFRALKFDCPVCRKNLVFSGSIVEIEKVLWDLNEVLGLCSDCPRNSQFLSDAFGFLQRAKMIDREENLSDFKELVKKARVSVERFTMDPEAAESLGRVEPKILPPKLRESRKILADLGGRATYKELETSSDWSRSTIRRRFSELEDRGIIKRVETEDGLVEWVLRK